MNPLTQFKKRSILPLLISTCALALGAFTASAAPDSGRIPIRTGDNRTVAIGVVRPLGRHPAPANHFSTTTAAKVGRPTSCGTSGGAISKSALSGATAASVFTDLPSLATRLR